MQPQKEIVLFHWNILELADDVAIFVGMRVSNETTSAYVFRYSTAIKLFDEETGIGVTKSGRIYRCVGRPSDPNGEIRMLVTQMTRGYLYNFRYMFD